jgi:hypothetical protein
MLVYNSSEWIKEHITSELTKATGTIREMTDTIINDEFN